MIKPLAYIWIRFLFFFRDFQKRKQLDKKSIKSILFVELLRMGDVVSIMPSINCIAQHFKDVKLSFAVDKNFAGIIKIFFPEVKIIPFERSDTLKGLMEGIRSINNSNFDLICSMSPSYRNAYTSLRIKSKFKVGFFGLNTSFTPFLNKNRIRTIGFVNNTSELFFDENIVERGYKICKALGIKGAKEYSSNLPRNPKAIIVVHPFSGWEFRNWRLENFSETIDRLCNDFQIEVVIIGSESERIKGEKLLAMVKHKDKVKLFFNQKIEDVIRLLSCSALFIGNDSGPLHLATVVGVPAIGLYGPAPPKLTAPYSQKNVLLHKSVECCPCEQVNCIRENDPCINLITVDEVVEEAKNVLLSQKESLKI